MKIGQYRWWDILDNIPEGWQIDDITDSPISSSVFITNGENILSGKQKRAILKIESKQKEINTSPKEYKYEQSENYDIDKDFDFHPKTVNTLARKKFEEQLLKEIQFDLMVCEIEGWNKKEYIIELIDLLNSINLQNKNNQLSLF